MGEPASSTVTLACGDANPPSAVKGGACHSPLADARVASTSQQGATYTHFLAGMSSLRELTSIPAKLCCRYGAQGLACAHKQELLGSVDSRLTTGLAHIVPCIRFNAIGFRSTMETETPIVVSFHSS